MYRLKRDSPESVNWRMNISITPAFDERNYVCARTVDSLLRFRNTWIPAPSMRGADRRQVAVRVVGRVRRTGGGVLVQPVRRIVPVGVVLPPRRV